MGGHGDHRRVRRAAPSKRSGFVLLAAMLLLGVVAAALDGGRSSAVAAASAIALAGVAILAVAHLVLAWRERVATIGLQFATVVAGGTLAGAGSAWLVVALHDASSGDGVLLASMLAATVVLVVWAAYVVGMAVGDDIDVVADELAAVGAGDRSARLTVGGGDQVARLAAAGNAMTEQLRLCEAERDEAQATRHALIKAMVDQLRERAAERDRAEAPRRTLFVGVSHDLRTPLTGLQLLANAIRDELIEPEQRAVYAERMLAQIASLTQLTEQVFELSRIEAGEVTWTRVRMPVDGVVRETTDQMRARADARGFALVVDLPDDLPTVELAPERIARVLVNLLQNALEHTPAGGAVRVAVRASDAGVDVTVADTGSGIDREDREHIFEPFYRGGEGAARGGAGAGLGLAISRAIVEAHGGRMWLADTASGSTVGFSLPR